MKKSNKEKGTDKDYENKILEFIKQKGEVSIAELDEIKVVPSRQTLRYNLRKLCMDKSIIIFIKMKAEGGFVVPREDEMFCTVINEYEQPQYVLNLINQMCGTQVISDFVNLYMDRAEKTFIINKKEAIENQEKRKIRLIDEGIKLYDSDIPLDNFYRLELPLQIDKKGLTREEYIGKIKKQVSDEVNYEIQGHSEHKFEDIASKEKQEATELAFAILCNMSPGLKEKAAFSLTLKNESGGYNLIDKSGVTEKEKRNLVMERWRNPSTS